MKYSIRDIIKISKKCLKEKLFYKLIFSLLLHILQLTLGIISLGLFIGFAGADIRGYVPLTYETAMLLTIFLCYVLSDILGDELKKEDVKLKLELEEYDPEK
jgi:hypothetical protein